MPNDASKASSYVDYVDFDFPAILSIDFAFLLNIMLLEAKKWFVPKCSTIQNAARKGVLMMPQAKLISPITRQEVRKVRVAAYCRVSSNSADQQNSYANQIRVYTTLIQRKKEWELVEIFADEGLSGMKAQNRTEFQRMIKMCERGCPKFCVNLLCGVE